eukprot:gb/GECH01010151.1/.p1 GENE.gb/GECH01010151.1/~~gb/GECH01010151.1/.p1  ORF type:complete len:347 (+),score=66.54 gb/GECH01010151.1/:1-1041(+)
MNKTCLVDFKKQDLGNVSATHNIIHVKSTDPTKNIEEQIKNAHIIILYYEPRSIILSGQDGCYGNFLQAMYNNDQCNQLYILSPKRKQIKEFIELYDKHGRFFHSMSFNELWDHIQTNHFQSISRSLIEPFLDLNLSSKHEHRTRFNKSRFTNAGSDPHNENNKGSTSSFIVSVLILIFLSLVLIGLVYYKNHMNEKNNASQEYSTVNDENDPQIGENEKKPSYPCETEPSGSENISEPQTPPETKPPPGYPSNLPCIPPFQWDEFPDIKNCEEKVKELKKKLNEWTVVPLVATSVDNVLPAGDDKDKRYQDLHDEIEDQEQNCRRNKSKIAKELREKQLKYVDVD